jgi:branched-chain amino acid transport system permease protein
MVMFDILPQLLANSLITGSIYALASAGLVLTFALLRFLNFAHGHLMMVGAYTFFYFSVAHHLSLAPAAGLTILCMALLGSIVLRVFVQPFLTGNSLLPLVTTIALGSILEAVISIQFGVNVRSLPLQSGIESLEWRGIFITPLQIFIIVSAILILSALAFLIHQTGFGRRIRAVAENSAAAESLGVSRPLIVGVVFLVSVILAGFAGVLVGYETNIQPTMGGSYSIKAFAAMVLGGLGNIWGTVAGALILGLVENLSIGLDFGGYSLPAGYKDAFAFLTILAILLFRPQGLFGTRQRTT